MRAIVASICFSWMWSKAVANNSEVWWVEDGLRNCTFKTPEGLSGSGNRCILPFTFEGQKHNGCVALSDQMAPYVNSTESFEYWCATTATYSVADVITREKWGICDCFDISGNVPTQQNSTNAPVGNWSTTAIPTTIWESNFTNTTDAPTLWTNSSVKTPTPTVMNTSKPTNIPTNAPTATIRTKSPTIAPSTSVPTMTPTKAPTDETISLAPTRSPTRIPTISPTASPTMSPSAEQEVLFLWKGWMIGAIAAGSFFLALLMCCCCLWTRQAILDRKGSAGVVVPTSYSASAKSIEKPSMLPSLWCLRKQTVPENVDSTGSQSIADNSNAEEEEEDVYGERGYVHYQGYVQILGVETRKGKSSQHWKSVYLVLMRNGALLCYSNAVETNEGGKAYCGELWSLAPDSIVSVHETGGSTSRIQSGTSYRYTVDLAWGDNLFFATATSSGRNSWMRALRGTIGRTRRRSSGRSSETDWDRRSSLTSPRIPSASRKGSAANEVRIDLL